MYTRPFQLTEKIHRDVPEYLQPEQPQNSQKGRIIVITGGGTGIGAVCLPPAVLSKHLTSSNILHRQPPPFGSAPEPRAS